MVPGSSVKRLLEEEVLDWNMTIRVGFPLLTKLFSYCFDILLLCNITDIDLNVYLEVILHMVNSCRVAIYLRFSATFWVWTLE